MEFVYTSERHPSSATFPYTSVHLANALHFLKENMEVVENMSLIDFKEVPEGEANDLLQWNKVLTKEQDQKFEELLKLE